MRGWAAPSSGGAPQSPGGVSKPPEWKECGTRWAISKFHFCMTLPENEARGLVPCHLFSSPSDHLEQQKRTTGAGRRRAESSSYASSQSTQNSSSGKCFKTET